MSRLLIAPMLHPAGISRGQFGKEPAQEAYLRRIAECIRGERTPELVDIDKPPPDTLLFPSVPQLEEFTRETRDPSSQWDFAAVDIENAGPHILCIGFTQLDLEAPTVGRTVCVHFRRQHGRRYWSKRDDLLRVVELVDDLLGDPRVGLVFHNGVSHDVPILEELGFEVQGRLLDTMFLSHVAYPEAPKGLQHCATLHLWAPVWKSLTEETDEEEGKA